MTLFKIIIRSLKKYAMANIATAMGIAISTAVICGALIIGDSLNSSLLKIVDNRLGETTHTITAGDRIFTQDLATELNNIDGVSAAPVLKTTASISAGESNVQLNNIQVFGINNDFLKTTNCSSEIFEIGFGEAVISSNIATRLMIDAGDHVLVRFKSKGAIPYNTPFVTEDDQIISRRVKIIKIADDDNCGRFNLQTTQSAPFNMFINIDWFNRISDLDNNANLVVISAADHIKKEEIEINLQKSWGTKDGNILVNYLDDINSYKITSQRVFIEKHVADKLKELFPDAEFYLTYFVNSLISDYGETPYSFVTASNRIIPELSGNEIIINKWLAEDLNVKTGDRIKMKYYEVGQFRELTEKEIDFEIVQVIPMHISEKDLHLMPHLPGLTDVGNCRDWDTGIPIDLNKIRDKDEEYWDKYQGTPKAYISLESGKKLWENRFGVLTTVIINSKDHAEKEIYEKLNNNLDPFLMEFRINEVREQGILAAESGVDFSQLFAGLGIFIIIAGLILTVLLLNLSIKKRQEQIKLFDSLGFSGSLIKKILAGELIFIVFAGVITGLFVSIAYSNLILSAINEIWNDIVRIDVLEIHFTPITLIAGCFISLILGFVVCLAGISRTLSKLNKAGKKKNTNFKKFHKKAGIIIPSILLFASLFIITSNVISGDFTSLFQWLTAGILLLFAFIMFTFVFLGYFNQKPSKKFDIFRLSKRNLSENPLRSFTIIVLLSLGSFVIVVTAANQKDLLLSHSDISSGTGGFLFMAETGVPVLRDLNNKNVQTDLGIPANTFFVQFLSAYDDDASCLNLNRAANPRILAVKPELMLNRFSFASKYKAFDNENPWMTLNNEFESVIPAIADQTVLQWGLGKSTGDTLYYTNSFGEEIKLLLIGGLENSVFQGNIIISEKFFNKHFPAQGGSNVFLIGSEAEPVENLKSELSFIFRDHGIEIVSTVEKLAEFNSVENTYLRIFFMLGAFGMLIGTIGLAVVLAKNLIERRKEIALLSSVGYGNSKIIRILAGEYILLFITGIFVGKISGIVATFPSFIAGSQTVSGIFLPIVTGILILNGLFWILIIQVLMLRRVKDIKVLMNE